MAHMAISLFFYSACLEVPSRICAYSMGPLLGLECEAEIASGSDVNLKWRYGFDDRHRDSLKHAFVYTTSRDNQPVEKPSATLQPVLATSPEIRTMARLHKWQTGLQGRASATNKNLGGEDMGLFGWIQRGKGGDKHPPICPHPPDPYIAAHQDKSNRKQIRSPFSPPFLLPPPCCSSFPQCLSSPVTHIFNTLVGRSRRIPSLLLALLTVI